MAATTEVMDPQDELEVIVDGDVVLLHCPDTSGVVYSKPFGSKEPDLLTIESTEKKGFVLEFAAFCITQRKQPNRQNKIKDSPQIPQLMEIVHGSTIKLQHQVSGKYLTVVTSPNGNKQTLCLAFDEDKSGDSNSFKIIPPHQEKGWGESLKISESIKLKSITCRGGKIKFQHKPEENCYRPSMETDGTMFSMEFYCQNHAKLSSKCIKERSVVMLASTRVDGYLSAKGSFVSKRLSKEMQHNVGLRRWQKGFFNITPFSGDTFFQLENIESMTNKGSQLSFNTKCRIKHLLTQQYISVENESFKLVDENSKFPSADVFEIKPSDKSSVPSDESSSSLHEGVQIILQHGATNKYLSFNSNETLDDNEWCTFSHFSELILTDEEMPFKVLQVEKLVMQDAYQVMGMCSALCESLEKITANSAASVTPDVLKSQIRIVINIMEQLRASFDSICCKNSSCHIKTVESSNHKTRQANMLRTFQMIDIMISLLEEMTKISTGALEDLAKIDDECFQEACNSICLSLQMYVEYGSLKSILYLARNKPLLEIIGKLVGKCSSADKVLITLLNKYRETSQERFIFYLIENLNLKNSEVAGLMFTLSFNEKWINWKIYEKINIRLFTERTLSNYDQQLIIADFIPNDAQELLKDFVREGQDMERTMTATNMLCNTCVFIKAEETIDSQAPYNDQFPQKCVQCIQAIQSALPNESACSLLVQLMNVLVFLVDYGAIKISKDVADIIIKLLRNEDTETCNQCVTTVSLKIKKLALLSLKLLLKRNFHAAIEALLNDFNALRKKTGDANEMASWDSSNIELTSVGIQLPNNNGNPPHGIIKVLLDHRLEVKKEHWGQVIKESQARLRHNFNCNQGYSIFDIATDEGQELCHILIELVDNNNNDADIQLMSTELLYDIYSVEETVLSEAKERTYFTYSEEEVHKKMKELATMTDKEQLLYKMLRREIDESAADDLQKLLERMTEACIFEDDETKPNSISQNVAYSCGLFNVILEHVLEHKDSSDLQNHEIIILTKCFTLLQKLSRKNKKAQKKLFTSFHDFLQTKRKDMIRPVICLLNEVFFRNSVLCKKLTETDIDNIFSTAIISEDPEHHKLIITMTIVIESTSPALPIQEYVARLILHHSTSTLKSLFGQEMKSARKNILRNESNDDNRELCLLINVTHLLASCCTRECQVAESAAAQIYSIDELLNIITDDVISPARKFPFIRVLTWTYLITEMDSAVACSKLISTKNFWKFLKHFSTSIANLENSAKSDKEKTRLKFLKKSDLTIHILTMDRKSPSENINEILIYIIEGIIPMLSGLCEELSCHLYAGTIPDMIQKNIDITIIRILGDKLKVIYELEVCSVLEQMEEMMCMKKISSLCKFYEIDLELLQLTNDSVLEKTDEDNLNDRFQTFITNYSNAYNNSPGDMKNVPIPKGHSFEKLLEVFVDEDYTKKKIQSLKVYKLILVLRTLIERQKVLGLHCFERTNLEKMTLTTLQLLYGLVYKRIVTIKSKRDSLKPAEFQKQYKKFVQPIQAILLHEEVDCIQTLFELLNHPNDEITYQVLACLDVLLYPGNEEAQRKVTSIIEQDQSLLVCVQKILKEAQNKLNKSKVTTEESVTEQASTSFMPEPENTLSPKVKEEIDDRITMALDVLVWLCDGQQKIMQDALTTPSKFSGSNIVSQVSFLLLDIIEGTAEDLKIIIAQKAFQALIEMCAGNYNNQCIALRGQVIVSINAVLQKESSDTQVRDFSELKSSSLELLEVMLEKIDEESSTLADWIVKQLDIQNLLKGMLHSWQCYSRAAPTCLLSCCNAVKRIFVSEATSPARNSLFIAYHALRRISIYQKISVDELVESMLRSNSEKNWSSKEAKESATEFDKLFKDNVIEAKKMWQHCKKWSRAVEITYKPKHDTEILTQAYFPYNPHTHLSEEHKSTILLNIKRNTPQEKLFDLLKWTDKVKSMKERKDNLKRYGIFQFSTIRHYMLYCLTIILNLMILFSLRFPTNNYNGQACSAAFNDTCNSSSPMYFQPILSPDVPTWYMPLLYIFGLTHLVLALWMVIQYFIKNERNDVRFLPYSVQMFIYKANKGLLRRKSLYQFISKLNDVLCHGKISADKPEPIAYFQIFFFSFQSLYRILFVLFSAAGLATKGYFYCGCILYPFLNNKVMSFIIRALRKSAFQLLTVLTLCFICTYIYAVVSFALLQNYFSEAKDEFCNTLLECFITVSRLGLLNTLGSGLSIRPSDEYEPNFQLLLARTVYDIIFFVVVTTLGLNIVIAILVDRFSEMREETDKVDDDNKTRCLVCSITKDELERQGQSSKKHINEDHNVWNYINFVMYLDTLHKNDYNALEKYVSHQVESGSIDFFPLKADSVM